MIAIMWQFDVKDGREAEFEQLYGADGDWTTMNRHTRSYLGTSFLRDQNRSGRYLVIEYWSEMIVYEQHRAYRSDVIVSLEERRTALVEAVEPVGILRRSMSRIGGGRPGRSAIRLERECLTAARLRPRSCFSARWPEPDPRAS